MSPAAEAAIGRLLTGGERSRDAVGPRRSAFVIDGGHVLTAWHCVAALGGAAARPWLRLRAPEPGAAPIDVPLRCVDHRPDLDAALLAVDPLRLPAGGDGLPAYLDLIALPLAAEVGPHDAVRVGGHPERNPARSAVVFTGEVATPDAHIGRRRVIRVQVAGFAAASPESPSGMSGGPLLRGTAAVGFVSSYATLHRGETSALGGVVLCGRVADLRDAFPAVGAALHSRDARHRGTAPARTPAPAAAAPAVAAPAATAAPAPAPAPAAGERRPERLGRPIGECDPLELEVHRAIEVEGAPAPGSPLPPYLERNHDRELHAVAGAVMAGASALVTLVGDSSTGKTRACWELLQRLDREQPGRWRLWHPLGPTPAQAAADRVGEVGPGTVVWLNDAEQHLRPADVRLGERTATGLRALLRDRARGPVLVLATLWRAEWSALTVPPPPGGSDPHNQARRLLEEGTTIAVADAFTDAELALLGGPGADPRLRAAAAHAEGGRITQYLAGVPVLERRYRAASAEARALIHVAMDARRFGHHREIPRRLFELAACGYLRSGWDATVDGWLDAGLDYTGRPCRGIGGPLSPVRPRPFDPPAADPQPRYRLAEHLDQIGRSARAAGYPPEDFWLALATVVSDAELLHHLAEQTYARSRYQHTIWLSWAAALRGRLPSLRLLAEWRERLGDPAGAEQVYAQAAAAGSADGRWLLGRRRELGGHPAEARALYRRAARQGSGGALRDLGRLSERDGDTQAAQALYRRAAGRGDAEALGHLALLWEKTGDPSAAEALAVRAGRAGHPGVLIGLARYRERAGDVPGAYVLWQVAAVTTNNDHIWERAHWLMARCDGPTLDRAMALETADFGDLDRLRDVSIVDKLPDDRAAGEHFRWVRRTLEIYPLAMAADERVRGYDLEGALAVYRPAVERGMPDAIRMSGRVEERFGHADCAEARYRDALDRGDRQAHHDLGGLWNRTGQRDRADRLHRYGLDRDGEPATGLDFDLPGGLSPRQPAPGLSSAPA